MRVTQRCQIGGCRAMASIWLKDAGPYDGLALCAPCAARVRETAVAEVLAGPAIREMFGLPPLSSSPERSGEHD